MSTRSLVVAESGMIGLRNCEFDSLIRALERLDGQNDVASVMTTMSDRIRDELTGDQPGGFDAWMLSESFSDEVTGFARCHRCWGEMHNHCPTRLAVDIVHLGGLPMFATAKPVVPSNPNPYPRPKPVPSSPGMKRKVIRVAIP